MAFIYETENFVLETQDKPFVDRAEGGHVKILPKVKVEDRTKLSPELAKELMKLTMVVGEALKIGLGKRGIEIGRVNYQDMGNWGPFLHIHIFGRAKSATVQKYGEAVYLPKRESGFYDAFKPLDENDIAEIKNEIDHLMNSDKYKNF